MSGFFKSQRRRVQDALEKNGDQLIGNRMDKGIKAPPPLSERIDLIWDADGENKKLHNTANKPIKNAFFDYAVRSAHEHDPQFDFNMHDPVGLRWIEEKTTKISREINEWTLESISQEVKDSIEEALAEGYSRGETIAQIADRIDEIYDFAVKGRSERIARTEIISASNKGTMEGLKSVGVELKEWVSSRDYKVRESHAELDDQDPIGINDYFITITGEKLLQPGDPSADAGEVINCRCAVIGVVGDQSA